MDVTIPYTNPYLFIDALKNKYNFPTTNYWNANILTLPAGMGEGNMQVFIRENMHFIRSKWAFPESSSFFSPDEVRQTTHIDFRIGASGHVESSYLEGAKKYEWDITRVNGMRIFLPKECLSDQRDPISRLNKYCIDNNVSRLMKELFAICPEDTTSSMLLEGKFLEFIHMWLQFMNGKDIESHFEDLSDWHFKQLQEAKVLIETSIDNPCGIKKLSRKVNMNECDLKRGFKKLNGLSIHQYVIKLRMEKAQDMILNSDNPISDICSQLGYTNRGHFAQLYFKYFGESPLQHRLKKSPPQTFK